MSESKFVSVSSLVDNDQSNDNMLDDILSDKEMSDAWERYHLISDVMHGDTSPVFALDLSDQIAAAIAQEPTILAPNKSASAISVLKAKVVHFAKPLGQMAIAASAAGLMIFGMQQNPVDNEQMVPSQVIQTTPFAGVANPVSFNTQSNDRQAKKQAYVEQHRRFQALLSDHQQQIKLTATDAEKQYNEADDKQGEVEELNK